MFRLNTLLNPELPPSSPHSVISLDISIGVDVLVEGWTAHTGLKPWFFGRGRMCARLIGHPNTPGMIKKACRI